MPRGIPNSGVRKTRATRGRRTTTGAGKQLGAQFWNQIERMATQLSQLHQNHSGKQTTRGRRGRSLTGTGQRATGTRQRKVA